MKSTERPEDVLHLDDVSRYYVSVNNIAVDVGKFDDVLIFRN